MTMYVCDSKVKHPNWTCLATYCGQVKFTMGITVKEGM